MTASIVLYRLLATVGALMVMIIVGTALLLLMGPEK